MTRPTQARLKDAAALRYAVRELVAAVEVRLEPIRSGSARLPQHFAAMALARSGRLVRSMLLLRDNDLEDVSDVPLRQVAEHLVLGLYLLYGGEDALDHIRGSHVYDLGLISAADGGTRPIVNDWTGPRDRIKWQDLMHNVVAPLVEAATGDTTASASLRNLYDDVYRGQSLFVSHAGVGTISRHITTVGSERGIDIAGYLIEDGTGPIVLAGALHSVLAIHVLDDFGVLDDEVVRVALRVRETGDLIVEP